MSYLVLFLQSFDCPADLVKRGAFFGELLPALSHEGITEREMWHHRDVTPSDYPLTEPN